VGTTVVEIERPPKPYLDIAPPVIDHPPPGIQRYRAQFSIGTAPSGKPPGGEKSDVAPSPSVADAGDCVPSPVLTIGCPEADPRTPVREAVVLELPQLSACFLSLTGSLIPSAGHSEFSPLSPNETSFVGKIQHRPEAERRRGGGER
ncbi:hypothetical protein THAOC_23456, partial [Thalassiosira oceanica]